MASESPSMTRTDRNLWSAIVAEAMAYLKYNAYAHRALEEGHPEVAQVFQEVAGAETIHGINHLRVSGDIKPTIENLRTVTTGEAKEFSTIYPRMIQDAIDEGNQAAADSFNLALERERHHLVVFTEALALLDQRVVVVCEAETVGLRAAANRSSRSSATRVRWAFSCAARRKKSTAIQSPCATNAPTMTAPAIQRFSWTNCEIINAP